MAARRSLPSVAALILAACASIPRDAPPTGETGARPARPEAGAPRPEPRNEALYAALFVRDTCFRYRAIHREQSEEEDGPPSQDVAKEAQVRCCVAEVRRFALGKASRVRCTMPRSWTEIELTGNPPIDPVFPLSRVYIATPQGLWWSTKLPATDAQARRLTQDPLRQMLALPATETSDKNVEDEDVSYTTTVEADEHGHWCWEQVERDDYAITERVCFGGGTVAHSRRSHALDDDLDTTTLELIP